MATRSTASRARVASTRSITPNAATAKRTSTAPAVHATRPWNRTLPTPAPTLTLYPGGGTTVGHPPRGIGTPVTVTSVGSFRPILPPLRSGGGRVGSVTQPKPGVSSSTEGGTAGGFSNAMSGDLFGQLGLSLPKVFELVALALAAWLGWKYLSRKAGKR
jgi:hypothetical protein